MDELGNILPSLEEFQESIKDRTPEEQQVLLNQYRYIVNQIEMVNTITDIINNINKNNEIVNQSFKNVDFTLQNHKEAIDQANQYTYDLSKRVYDLERILKYLTYIGYGLVVVLIILFWCLI